MAPITLTIEYHMIVEGALITRAHRVIEGENPTHTEKKIWAQCDTSKPIFRNTQLGKNDGKMASAELNLFPQQPMIGISV